MSLVDGGIVNNVPADVLIQQDQCDFVIAVDVGAKFADEFAGNHAHMASEEMTVPGAFQTLIRSMDVQRAHLRSMHANVADFIIEPDVSTVDVGDFQHAVDIAALGQAAAESACNQLVGQLRSLDVSLVASV
jgi:predicted acylesterase/phospholipase RssA